ncbi:hypothetical protein NA57DRAFT_68893 [Rhizodiscina lignyota]|uniref:PRISE-like Rossmann-fold domain-containing protein n=1 Tax=Rhizodiscina lignyota TaxID=1504668 RepID=A0A9P4I5H1_9PEZI|nr:hypothetical protein NA57DRAFT_68893 [Rhizodiscina lignyota]
MGNHALIYGASGITGWAIVNAILEGYPDAGAFDKVTALTNRPLSADAAIWPKSEKLQVVSGIDLGKDGVQEDMKKRIKDVDTVSHVYFFAYIMDPEPQKEIDINVDLLKRAVESIDSLSTKLKFVVLPTGTKAYGVHLLDKFPWPNELPVKESLPRIPEPYASEMFYYNQCDMLDSLSKGKSWTWCEVRPDMIVGFVPNNNIYCLAQHLALYLTLYRTINGAGAEVPFPGTEISWTNLSNDSGQDLIARFSIYVSLHPETCGNGEAFNTCDSSKPTSWSTKWPTICEYFELKGTPPPAGGSGPQPPQYVAEHLSEWRELEKKHGLQAGRVGNERSFGGFPYFIMTMLNFDRQMDMTKTLKTWGEKAEEWDTKQTWYTAFDRFRKAKIIP